MSSLLWRVTLLAIGIIWGSAQFAGDWLYTRGGNDLDFRKLVLATKVFPFSHDYRIALAEFALRDREWQSRQAVIRVLKAVQKDDPHSRFLTYWIKSAQQ